ncbi:MAG: beta-ketoacyl-[acyl-carrier-protein] synthase II, partial [Limisphaerales bacterium]
ISYINAHGTSTPQGDICEAKAVNNVFGDHAKNVVVSSTKGATGHLLGAAGATEMALCAKAIEKQIAPPTINVDDQDPECAIDCAKDGAREMSINAVLNNSFGFGGHNATIAAKKFVG